MTYDSKNHHYVPRFYLENFACETDESRLFSMNRDHKIHKNKISKICSQNNYNSPEQERLQSRFEREFSSILKEMMENRDPTDVDLNLRVLKFVGFMLGNNIKKRKSIAESISSLELQIEGLENNHKILIDNDHRGRFELSLAFSNAFFQNFLNWKFIRREMDNAQKAFITSDDPVSIFKPENLLSPTYIEIEWEKAEIESFDDTIISENKRQIKASASFTLGDISFEKDVMMIFPITPMLCLIGFSESNRYAQFMESHMSNANINDLINTITFCYRYKAAYSPSQERLKETVHQLPRVLPM